MAILALSEVGNKQIQTLPLFQEMIIKIFGGRFLKKAIGRGFSRLCFGVSSRLRYELLRERGRHRGKMRELPGVIAQSLTQCAQIDYVVPQFGLRHMGVNLVPTGSSRAGAVTENLT